MQPAPKYLKKKSPGRTQDWLPNFAFGEINLLLSYPIMLRPFWVAPAPRLLLKMERHFGPLTRARGYSSAKRISQDKPDFSTAIFGIGFFVN
jgi:hypothetical protein